MVKGTHEDEYAPTRPFKTKRFRWTYINVETLVVKRDTGVKRLPRYFSTKKS